jgi:hypothetical protein
MDLPTSLDAWRTKEHGNLEAASGGTPEHQEGQEGGETKEDACPFVQEDEDRAWQGGR